MISSFDNDIFDLSGQMNAIVLKNVNVISSNPVIQVYIPKIMPNISKGEPKITKLQTKGVSIFKNADKKPVLTSHILHEKNYMETKFNASSNIDDLNNASENLLKEINSSIQKLASVNELTDVSGSNNKSLTYTINKNSEIRVEFLNSKLNKLAYSTIDKTNATKNLE